jgi:small-conductance mechanosensitive channel
VSSADWIVGGIFCIWALAAYVWIIISAQRRRARQLREYQQGLRDFESIEGPVWEVFIPLAYWLGLAAVFAVLVGLTRIWDSTWGRIVLGCGFLGFALMGLFWAEWIVRTLVAQLGRFRQWF